MTPLVFSSHCKHALGTHKHSPGEGQAQDVPLRCVPVAVCLGFMCLQWRRWIWVIQCWNGCAGKRGLPVSLQWALTGCHCWGRNLGQRKGPSGVTHGVTRFVFPLAVSEGKGDVGEQCLEVPPFSFPSQQGLGDAEITRITNLHMRLWDVQQVAETCRVYAWTGSVQIALA